MDSVSQNVGVRAGGCFFLDERETGFEDRFFVAAFVPFEPRLGGDLGLLTGITNRLGFRLTQKIIAQMVCFSLRYN